MDFASPALAGLLLLLRTFTQTHSIASHRIALHCIAPLPTTSQSHGSLVLLETSPPGPPRPDGIEEFSDGGHFLH